VKISLTTSWAETETTYTIINVTSVISKNENASGPFIIPSEYRLSNLDCKSANKLSDGQLEVSPWLVESKSVLKIVISKKIRWY
jgi:hypothetical protein